MSEEQIKARQTIEGLMLAYILFEDDDKETIAAVYTLDFNSIGLCHAIEYYAGGYSDILDEAFDNLYGSSFNPFKQFGAGYFELKLNHKFRASKIPEIISWIEQKYNV